MAVEIRIDREKCMGSGNCSFWAPGTFDLDDEGIATVVDPEGDTDEKIILAAQGVPHPVHLRLARRRATRLVT
jgi:Ferredoxin